MDLPKVALLVADDPILRALWQQLLHLHHGSWCFIHSPGGHEALRALEVHDPALVISDASLGAVDVVDLVKRVADEHHGTLVVLAGDSTATSGLEGDLIRISRVESGTIELPALVQERLDAHTVDLRERAPYPEHAGAREVERAVRPTRSFHRPSG